MSVQPHPALARIARSDRQRRPWRSPLFAIGALLAALLIGAVVLGPALIGHDPAAARPAMRLQPPGAAAWLGADRYGRDVLARVLHGGRLTLLVSAAALGLVVVLGLGLGVLAGYLGGWVDRLVSGLIDLLLAFPSTVLALVVAGLFGAGLGNLLLALVSVWWVGFARIARSSVLAVKPTLVIEAARALGAPTRSILWGEIVPRALGPVLVLATLELGHLVLTIAGLSYLGLGAQPPSPEWGAMLADGRAFAGRAPHLLLAPAGAVLLTVLALNCLGEGLRDQLEPPAQPWSEQP
ncbi:MAG TPA: ABC transporter permease [Herpetosiphonaceae bacterium]|nr:ABC transporter permease [Herpetosiphonaceae bacterium]